MTDNHHDTPENSELSLAEALRLVAAAGAAEVDRITGDERTFTDQMEIQRQHLAAVAMAERMITGDHQAVIALLPTDLNSALSQVMACTAVTAHIAKFAAGDEWPDLLAQVRAQLLARESE